MGYQGYGSPFGGGMPSSPMSQFGLPSYGYQGYGATDVGGASGGSGDIASTVGGWLMKHPEAVVAGLGAGLGYLGDRAKQNSADKQQVVANQQWGQEYGLQQRQTALSEKELQAKLDADSAEKARRGAAIRQILGMDRTPVNQQQPS